MFEQQGDANTIGCTSSFQGAGESADHRLSRFRDRVEPAIGSGVGEQAKFILEKADQLRGTKAREQSTEPGWVRVFGAGIAFCTDAAVGEIGTPAASDQQLAPHLGVGVDEGD